MLAYVDAFWLLGWTFIIMIPLVFLMKSAKPGTGAFRCRTLTQDENWTQIAWQPNSPAPNRIPCPKSRLLG